MWTIKVRLRTQPQLGCRWSQFLSGSSALWASLYSQPWTVARVSALLSHCCLEMQHWEQGCRVGVSWTELPWNKTPTHHSKPYAWVFSSLEFKWLHISGLWMLQELKTPAKSPSGEGCNSCSLRRFWNPHCCLRFLWSHTSSSVLAHCHLLMRTTNDDRPWVRLLRSNSVMSLSAKHLLQRYLWSSRMHSLLLGSLKVVSVRPAFPSQKL